MSPDPPTRAATAFPALPRYMPPRMPDPLDERSLAAQENSLIHRGAIWLAVWFVFIRFSLIHELLVFDFGVNTHLVMIFGPPTMLAVVLSGGIGRTLSVRPAYFWIAFAGWLTLATPFSFWKTGSLQILFTFLKSELPMLLIVAGAVVNLKELRWTINAAALGGVVHMAAGWLYAGEIWGGRLGLGAEGMRMTGSVSNPNDYATHMLSVLPFIGCAIYMSRSWILRGILLAAAAGGFLLTLRTASRAALLAILVGVAFVLFRMPVQKRVFALIVLPLCAVVAFALLPERVVQRYMTLLGKTEGEQVAEAVYSTELRSTLLSKALRFTVTHPVFGVGPGVFGEYEASEALEAGLPRGLWLAPHNTYTQVSSEAGLPALAFYLAAIVATYRVLDGVYKRARNNPALRQLTAASFSVMLSLVVLCVLFTFCSQAYRYPMPALTGFAIAVSVAARAVGLPAAVSGVRRP